MQEVFFSSVVLIVPNRSSLVHIRGISSEFGRAVVCIMATCTRLSQNNPGEIEWVWRAAEPDQTGN